MKNMSVFLVFLFLAMGCQLKVKDKNQSDSKGAGHPGQIRSQAVEPMGVAELVAGGTPNSYFISPNLDNEVCRQNSCLFALKLSSGKTFEKMEPAVEDLYFSVDPGQTYTAALLRASDLSIVESQDYQIPIDYEFSGEVHTLVNEEASEFRIETQGRIFLRKTHLITGNRNLFLKASELISEDSVIENFSSEDRAASGEHGKNGGLISFVVKKASGDLKVVLSGQNGGHGINAPDLVYHKGAQAQHGGSGQIRYEAGYLFTCDSPAGDGSDGVERGDQGLNGGDGGSGGSTGRLFSQIEDQSAFSLKIQYRPGEGGQRGLGGQGSFGQKGGNPGAVSVPHEGRNWDGVTYWRRLVDGLYPYHQGGLAHHRNQIITRCRLGVAKAGNDGPRGIQGQNGKPGIDGVITEISL